jgi:hypothetical protein
MKGFRLAVKNIFSRFLYFLYQLILMITDRLQLTFTGFQYSVNSIWTDQHKATLYTTKKACNSTAFSQELRFRQSNGKFKSSGTDSGSSTIFGTYTVCPGSARTHFSYFSLQCHLLASCGVKILEVSAVAVYNFIAQASLHHVF